MSDFITYKDLIEKTVPCEYVGKAPAFKVKEVDEYYCVMVEDTDRTPHTKGQIVHGPHLVGVEKNSGEGGWYISKNYHKRDGKGRGSAHVIKVANVSKFSVL
jgi:hypothetical protein